MKIVPVPLEEFAPLFRRVVMAFQPRGLEKETQAVYFEALRMFSREVLHESVTLVLRTSTFFPTTGEWCEAARQAATLIQTHSAADPPRGNVRTLPPEEVAESRRADRLNWEDAPCGCDTCQTAGVTDRPLRYVPTLTRDGDEEEHAWCPVRRRIVVVGHWAHGAELARWYAARAQFFGLFKTRVSKMTMPTGPHIDHLRTVLEALPETASRMAKADLPVPKQAEETA